MPKILFIVLALTLSASVSFSQGSHISRGASSTANGLLPLTIGSRWEYNTYSLDSNARKVAGTDKKEYDTITGTQAIGGRSAYVMHSKAGESVQPLQYFSYDQQGNLWSYVHTGKEERDGYWRELASFSDTVTGAIDTAYMSSKIGDSHFIDTVYQTYHGDGPLTVPAGNFMISMYSYTVNTSFKTRPASGSVEMDGRLYYARGVGLVKETNFKTLNSTVMNKTGGTYKELVSYSVK